MLSDLFAVGQQAFYGYANSSALGSGVQPDTLRQRGLYGADRAKPPSPTDEVTGSYFFDALRKRIDELNK